MSFVPLSFRDFSCYVGTFGRTENDILLFFKSANETGFMKKKKKKKSKKTFDRILKTWYHFDEIIVPIYLLHFSNKEKCFLWISGNKQMIKVLFLFILFLLIVLKF